MPPSRPDARFEHLVRRHAADLYRFAVYLTRDRHRAEDVVQEALVRGWRSFDRLRDDAAAKSWLFTIVRNEFYREREREAPRATDLDIDAIELADERASLFGLEMHDALRALPPAYGEPLALQVLGGFSCAQIARMLDTSDGAIMTRLTRARQALRRLIEPREGSARRRSNA
jgi:RNA polymerase sigma-70 factor, ECF subfamily